MASGATLPALAAMSPALLETLGRFHVIVVHFPIALLLVAGLAEAWAWFRKRESKVALPCLVLGTISGLVSVGSGWLHRTDGNWEGTAFTAHLYLGFATVT